MGDVELVEAVRRGDRRAWADVYDHYGPRLHAFCTRLLNEPHTAADAVQDTFVVAAQRFDQLRDPTKLRAWLYAIARNECTRHGRARGRVVLREEPDVVSTREVDDPGNQAAAAEVAEMLWAAAAGLDERDRILLELNVRHGLEGQELADAAGIRPGQIFMATNRMRDRVERSLGALLVARRGRDDCAGLAAVLSDWDGTFTVLMRKRVARHVEHCDLCDERRRSLVAPLGSLAALPFLLPPADLRDQVLEAISSVTDGGGGPDLPATHEDWPHGFPPVPPGPSRRRRAMLAAAALVAILVLVAGLLAFAGGGDTDAELVSGPAPSTTEAGASDDEVASSTTQASEAAPSGSSKSPSKTTPTSTLTTTATSTPATTPATGAPATTPGVGGPATTVPGGPTTPDPDPVPGPGPAGPAAPPATQAPPPVAVPGPGSPPATTTPPATAPPATAASHARRREGARPGDGQGGHRRRRVWVGDDL
ncbi:MAG: sigma-70 family RNA polymerase sigma factor, partial [Acidimicrobiales bacterium]